MAVPLEVIQRCVECGNGPAPRSVSFTSRQTNPGPGQTLIMKQRIILHVPPVVVCLLVATGGGTVSRGAENPAPFVAAETDEVRHEQVWNSDFEEVGLKGWSVIAVGGALGQMDREVTVRRGETNSHSLRLTVLNPGLRCGVSHQGESGIRVKAGSWSDLAFQARTEKRENDRGYGLTVSLESPEGGKVFARTTIPEVGGDWNQYAVALLARASDLKARLVITMSEPGTVWFDEVSLVERPMAEDHSR